MRSCTRPSFRCASIDREGGGGGGGGGGQGAGVWLRWVATRRGAGGGGGRCEWSQQRVHGASSGFMVESLCRRRAEGAAPVAADVAATGCGTARRGAAPVVVAGSCDEPRRTGARPCHAHLWVRGATNGGRLAGGRLLRVPRWVRGRVGRRSAKRAVWWPVPNDLGVGGELPRLPPLQMDLPPLPPPPPPPVSRPVLLAVNATAAIIASVSPASHPTTATPADSGSTGTARVRAMSDFL